MNKSLAASGDSTIAWRQVRNGQMQAMSKRTGLIKTRGLRLD